MAHRRPSLRRKLTLASVTLTVLTIAAAGWSAFRLERHSLERSTVANLETMAAMVATNVRTGLDFDDREDVLGFLRKVVQVPGIETVAVFADDGLPFASVGRADVPPGRAAQSGQYQDGWLGVVAVEYRNARFEPRTGQVVVRGSGEPIAVQLEAALRGLLTAGLVASIVLLVLTRALVQFLLAPVASLVQTAQRVRATRDYRQRAVARHDDEIGELVAAFNAMLDTIEQRDSALAGSAGELERQVAQRTEELRQAVQAAENATRAKSSFLANMSHEIRTPLNAVLGMTELALDCDNPIEQREYLETVRSAGNNLLGILNDILDFSKIESGKLELSVVEADLETVVIEALRPLTARVQSKHLELLLVLAPELGATYLVDDVRLRQILTNLVGNAIKFTEEGHVVVRVTTAGEGDLERVEIAIEDSGVGIPADRLEAVFSPFTQADNTITRRYSGTGLGLTICHHLTRLMGGSIAVQSEVGVGTTFRVQLPMQRTSMARPRPPLLPAGLRVAALCGPLQQEALTAAARRAAATVACFATAEALAAHLQAAPATDLVVLDHRDPDVDEVIAPVVPQRTGGIRPVLLLTSFQDLASAIARCTYHGYAGYLTKPLSPREFVQQLVAVVVPAAVAPAPARAAPAAGDVTPLRVLVAEDNPVNQKLVERLLEREGHLVTMTDNGRDCLDAFHREPFDIVLMDMQMPVLDGLETAQQIRKTELGTGRRVPIVALTANTSSEDREACRLAGMDEMLSKPMSVQRLRAALARFASTGERTAPPGQQP